MIWMNRLVPLIWMQQVKQGQLFNFEISYSNNKMTKNLLLKKNRFKDLIHY